MTTLLIAGATGLVGRHALRFALDDARVSHVVAPTRRPLQPHAKLHNPIVDFDALPADAPWWRVDAVACALGTTLRDAGSREAFRRVDLDYVRAIAAHARAGGARSFALVSSIGAGRAARTFYLRTKGEAEDAVAACGYPSVTVLRPSVIGGTRARTRPAEHLAMRALDALRPLVPRRYRVVPAERIARVLVDGALAASPGHHVVLSEHLAPEDAQRA